MKVAQRGFTLIELMIVVAIIAALGAIAVPAYQDYVVRSQVTEGVSLATGAKVALATHYANAGNFPSDNSAAGIASPTSISGPYVRSLTVDQTGLISVQFNASSSTRINTQILTLQATDRSGSLSWKCGGLDSKYLPSSCR